MAVDVPPLITRGLAPEGIVIRVYRLSDGAVLVDRRLGPNAPAEAYGEADAAAVTAILGKAKCVVVAYDGDTGQLISPPSGRIAHWGPR